MVSQVRVAPRHLSAFNRLTPPSLRDGECHVRALLDAGMPVGLGSDCSAGYMPSLLDAMRSAANVSRNLARRTGDDRDILSFSELVYLATMGGAQVLGLEDVVGNFVVGKKFDALIVEGDGVVSASAELWEQGGDAEAMVKKWVFLGDDRTIRRVYVDGVCVAGQDLTELGQISW
nr:putative guanine deaminase [Quercus suber]